MTPDTTHVQHFRNKMAGIQRQNLGGAVLPINLSGTAAAFGSFDSGRGN